MTSSQPAAFVAGPKSDVPVQNIAQFVFSNPFQHAPNTYAVPVTGKANPDHTFDGQPIPVQRPSLVHAATGATLTWERMRSDSLRIARSIDHLLEQRPTPFDGQERGSPIIDARTTVLLCLPNCLAFPPILLGAWHALCTVTTVSPLLMPRELAVILAKARPQLFFVATGEEGEGRMEKAIELIIQGDVLKDVKPAVKEEATRWAVQVRKDWQENAQSRYTKGDLLPVRLQRIWTVNVGATYAGGADYYGSSARRDGVSALIDGRDWSNLLTAPVGHRQAGALDSVARDAFVTQPMTLAEQRRRVALLMWSSGTTGMSKGVMISHHALVAATQTMWTTDPTLYSPIRRGGETWVALAPWTHVFGMMVLLMPAVAMGATMVLPPSPRFDLHAYLALVKRYNVTQVHVAPPVVVHLRNYILQARQRTGNDEHVKRIFENVRRISAGGAPTTYSAILDIYKALGKPVHQAYGTTETISTALATSPAYDAHSRRALEEIGSVGMAHSNVELAIHLTPACSTDEEVKRHREDILQDIEQSSPGRPHRLASSVPGEIWVRGPQNLLGYYSGLSGNDSLDEETTRASITSDGWFKTGDEGMLDAHGQLWIVGRLKELIKVKGFQVSPVELDAAFVRHEAVADAAAVGVKEKDGSEEICVYIEPRDKATLHDERAQLALVDKLTSYAVEHTAYYKWPKYICICSAIVKSPTGKILRKDLHSIQAVRHLAPRPSSSSSVENKMARL